MIDDT
jgi:hypothetical protein